MRCVILAGGGATRLGGAPKGLLLVEGRRILDRLVDAATAAFQTAPLLVANAPEATQWRPDLEVIPDQMPGHGALGGLFTAILAAGDAAVVVAWDMPFVPAALLARLAGGLESYDAFLPASDGRRGVEPLCAAYRSTCLAPIRAALDRGDRRAIAFHPDIRVGTLPLAEVERYGDPAHLFFNVNTPEDLAQAQSPPR